jgi:hypothetical protein
VETFPLGLGEFLGIRKAEKFAIRLSFYEGPIKHHGPCNDWTRQRTPPCFVHTSYSRESLFPSFVFELQQGR